jgi:spoIIIJ-associated protein
MDKLAAANKINEFLRAVITHGGLRIKYRITVDPPLPENRDWERPEILVDLAGPDSALLLDRGGELLRALELLAMEILRLPSGEHEKISFDCQNQRSLRLEELRMLATVAAEKGALPVCADVFAGAADGASCTTRAH